MKQGSEIRKWDRQGRPVPPPHAFKQRVLKEYAANYGLNVFVETGTYHGEMVEVMKPFFEQVYSIELSRELYERARERFRFDGHIRLLQGDSGDELGKIVKRIDQPALFWLDAHYSEGITARGEKDTPILEELHHILCGQYLGHVIIIDDARCFGSDPSYPSIEKLCEYVYSMKNDVVISVEDDMIRIVPVC